MTDLLRQEIAASADLIVVKVGTRVLTRPSGTLDEDRIGALADEINALLDGGRRVVLVSSGAVGAGLNELGFASRPLDVARLQAIAAVGQTRLIQVYDQTFQQRGRRAAQVLLTAGDLDHRARYLNVRNTLLTLLEFGAVPVINENDTVAVDELVATFGDNDRLAALVTNLLQAPLLVILSDVDGLYDGPPDESASSVIPTVKAFDQGLWDCVRDRSGGVGRGGMASKLEAARMVTAAGENVIIAGGRLPHVLSRIAAGEVVGTLLLAQGKTLSPRKRWLGYSARSCGRLVVDAGACRAVVDQGRSLLAIGIVDVQGTFVKGDLVSLTDPAGREFARGLTNYPSEELVRIRGLQSDQIAEVLGHRPYEEVVHRDNLAVVER